LQNELTELEKLDAIRSRMHVSYEEAKRALDESSGDMVKALSILEDRGYDIFSLGAEILEDVQKLIGAGSAKKLRVRFGGRVVKEIPLALTATAALLLGMTALLVTKASLEIDREEPEKG
jgi:hypothetical protein